MKISNPVLGFLALGSGLAAMILGSLAAVFAAPSGPSGSSGPLTFVDCLNLKTELSNLQGSTKDGASERIKEIQDQLVGCDAE